MLLLPKSQIAQKKADAQKQTIDEGQRLAKRIDNLRDTLLEEEKSLEKFRRETVALIHTQIVDERSILESLKQEVSILTDERKRLLIPLDDKWEEVNTEKKKNDLLLEEINSKTNELDRRKEYLDNLIKEAEISRVQADSLKTTNLNILEESEAIKKSMDDMLRDISIKKEKLDEFSKRVVAELNKREQEISLKERNYSNRMAILLKTKADIANGWKLLRDREKTLERNINRLKKK